MKWAFLWCVFVASACGAEEDLGECKVHQTSCAVSAEPVVNGSGSVVVKSCGWADADTTVWHTQKVCGTDRAFTCSLDGTDCEARTACSDVCEFEARRCFADRVFGCEFNGRCTYWKPLRDCGELGMSCDPSTLKCQR